MYCIRYSEILSERHNLLILLVCYYDVENGKKLQANSG